MSSLRKHALRAGACASLLALAACARQGESEMSWARAALERNDRIEVVAADEQSRTFTLRVKDTGELRMVRADQLIGGISAPAGPADSARSAPPALPAAPATAVATAGAAAPQAVPPAVEPAVARPGEVAVPEQVNNAEPPQPEPAAPPPADKGGGRVLKSGPGYSIKATGAPPPSRAAQQRDSQVTSAPVEKRHEPIVCQGQRLLHIDNRNLEFEGDAVSAQDGCEIHITNSHISATGIGVSARAANVHIDNSLIEGDSAAIDASQGAQVYATSTRFKGLSRRADNASFHDLGGNVWN